MLSECNILFLIVLLGSIMGFLFVDVLTLLYRLFGACACGLMFFSAFYNHIWLEVYLKSDFHSLFMFLLSLFII